MRLFSTDLVNQIIGVPEIRPQVQASISPHAACVGLKSPSAEADLSPEDLAERDAIRREIQDNLASMRQQMQKGQVNEHGSHPATSMHRRIVPTLALPTVCRNVSCHLDATCVLMQQR